jgi:hypothetical protein
LKPLTAPPGGTTVPTQCVSRGNDVRSGSFSTDPRVSPAVQSLLFSESDLVTQRARDNAKAQMRKSTSLIQLPDPRATRTIPEVIFQAPWRSRD